ncbi:MAG TPA: hypothetical protein VIK54_16410 [Acidimicrobiia bacterium]
MPVVQFLEYLREHRATGLLAEELADVLAQRRRRAPARIPDKVSAGRRIAS